MTHYTTEEIEFENIHMKVRSTHILVEMKFYFYAPPLLLYHPYSSYFTNYIVVPF
jgi:hypothetical protein